MTIVNYPIDFSLNVAPQPSLTTEYTPIQRGGVTPNASFTTPSASAPQVNAAPLSSGSLSAPSAILAPTTQPSSEPAAIQDDGVDPSTLPPVTAPPSHPAIDPTATGVFDGRSILEVDLAAMADKPWRRPGSDISDWFNYGFDEISWEAYCYRRRDLGELANVLKTNVIVSLSQYFLTESLLNAKRHIELCWHARRPADRTSARGANDGDDGRYDDDERRWTWNDGAGGDDGHVWYDGPNEHGHEWRHEHGWGDDAGYDAGWRARATAGRWHYPRKWDSRTRGWSGEYDAGRVQCWSCYRWHDEYGYRWGIWDAGTSMSSTMDLSIIKSLS